MPGRLLGLIDFKHCSSRSRRYFLIGPKADVIDVTPASELGGQDVRRTDEDTDELARRTQSKHQVLYRDDGEVLVLCAAPVARW